MITIIKNGKFTGTQYDQAQFSDEVAEFHTGQDETWVDAPRFEAVEEINGIPDYGEPTPEQLQQQTQTDFRSMRNDLLQEADIEIFKREDTGQDVAVWRQYRQALRDSTITWELPVKPL